MDEVRFRRSVRELLVHLYQPGYLHAHGLTALLLEAGLVRTADGVAALLLGCVEALRPPGLVPPSSSGWRQYRYLHLRYVECASHRLIAADLNISTRQACREHDSALDALARQLWLRCRAALGSEDAREAELSPPPTPEAAPASDPAMEAELLRLGSEPPDSPTSLREVLDGALATVARLLASREVVVRLELSADVPPVVVNRLALRHILLNLLGFVAAAGRDEDLIISAEVGPAEVELSFTLGGSGRSVYAASRRGEEPRGLAMARQLVELQGGQLRLEMAGDTPTRTSIVLPATQATTVLLVDDSADIGRLFRRYLAGTDYYLVHARSAEKARRLVQEVRPGVVLLDVLLPRDDGWQLLDSLRADETTAGVPVVVCSVVPEESLATSLGVEFLPKPVSRTALLASLEKACRQRSQAANPDRL